MKTLHSTKFLRRRKLLVFLPVLAFPFITFGFWMLGGGSTNSELKKLSGLNPELPSPADAKDPLDKLAFYERAEKDSTKLKEQIKNDPYRRDDYLRKEQEAERQLKQLEQALRESELEEMHASRASQSQYHTRSVPDAAVQTQDVDRLDQLMTRMKQKPQNDPEIAQLDSLLDKIIQVQQPPQALQTTKTDSSARVVEPYNSFSGLGTPGYDSPEGEMFYGLGESTPSHQQKLISAVVFKRQEIIAGSLVQLQLMSDVVIGLEVIPAGATLYGSSSISNNRLMVRVASLQHNGRIYPVSLTAYDMDGIAGINVPGSISRDVAKQSLSRMSPPVPVNDIRSAAAGHLLTAGVDASRNLLGRKAKQVKVLLPAGYRVFLVNDKGR